jgi:arylsulfatase A-like enzyme
LNHVNLPRQRLLRSTNVVLLAFALLGTSGAAAFEPDAAAGPTRRPNVLIVITDDQGWGDFGFHGNPVLKTPVLDRLASECVELTRFHVSPVCSPTRASLLTGRYNYRTGVVDTYLGRSTMAADETTLAEMFAAAGYRTGIFGKWHLGDNYPSRSIDQGFQESLVHRGGGIGQAADPPGNSYFDPVLSHNGHDAKTRGYCSDVFTDAAIEFVTLHRREPFFAYLAFNCPHTPLQVPPEYHRRYQNKDLDDDTAKVYGMIANIDDNLGRLLARFKELELDENTIVVFLTDNGPQVRRYNGVLNDLKGSVHDGGIRVACLMRWPGKFSAGRKVDQVAAHIDLVPTLLDACRIDRPRDVSFDGVSLLPILLGQQPALAERSLFFQWHRGDVPERGRACAVRRSRYKLVQPEGREGQAFSPAWALYDMLNDPGERTNLIDQQGELAAEMKRDYEAWFDDVGRTRGYPVPRIVVGSHHENPVVLTRQDWRGPQASWRENGRGNWEIDVAAAGDYRITVRVDPTRSDATLRLSVGQTESTRPVKSGAEQGVFDAVRLSPGRMLVEATIEQDREKAGPRYIELLRIDPAK